MIIKYRDKTQLIYVDNNAQVVPRKNEDVFINQKRYIVKGVSHEVSKHNMTDIIVNIVADSPF
ncbi:hypothetical protein SHAb15599_00082 [Acinetobacter phage SH-Ab 15599]|nr:hypothetical protein SHAb15599_00082 [Acinetobacter phage SH-Ab 15599]